MDAASQARLDRGERMVELLKQPVFSPMSPAGQVISIYIGSAGLLDDVPAAEVNQFALDFLAWLEENHPAIVDKINQTGQFEDNTMQQLDDALNQYKASRTPKEL